MLYHNIAYTMSTLLLIICILHFTRACIFTLVDSAFCLRLCISFQAELQEA